MREFSVQPLTANGGQPTACGERRWIVRSGEEARRLCGPSWVDSR